MNFKCNKSENLIKTLIHNVKGMSFGSAQKSIRLGNIKVNGKRTKQNITIKIGDVIEVYDFKKSVPNVDILYKDDNILIVNKPAGIECATRDKSSQNTYSLEEIFAEYNAIVVHRLDRLTEGIVILARTKEIAKQFEVIFKHRLIDKFYKAGVVGKFEQNGIQKAYLKKNSNSSIVTISDTKNNDNKEIITEFQSIKTSPKASLLNVKLHTGRTHQIRAHLAYLGHHIIGDEKYGKEQTTTDYKGYFLTADKIEFHITGSLQYLNDLNIEIVPTWMKNFNNLIQQINTQL